MIPPYVMGGSTFLLFDLPLYPLSRKISSWISSGLEDRRYCLRSLSLTPTFPEGPVRPKLTLLAFVLLRMRNFRCVTGLCNSFFNEFYTLSDTACGFGSRTWIFFHKSTRLRDTPRATTSLQPRISWDCYILMFPRSSQLFLLQHLAVVCSFVLLTGPVSLKVTSPPCATHLLMQHKAYP